VRNETLNGHTFPVLDYAVKDIQRPAICEIVGSNGFVKQQYNDFGVALTAVQSGETIRLLTDITYTSVVKIASKSITFALNGHDLTIDVDARESAFEVRDGSVQLNDAGGGEFNVINATDKAVTALEGAYVQVSNAASVLWEGVAASGNSRVVVVGDVSGGARAGGADGPGASIYIKGNVSATTLAVRAQTGGQVTIDGTVQAGGTNIIRTDSTNFTASGHSLTSSKPGYLEYTNGNSYVWVKDTHQVCEIVGSNGFVKKQYSDFGVALTEVLSGETIRLLEDISHTSVVEIVSKSITFALNGHDLTISVDSSSDALQVRGGGIQLNDAGGGEFNVINANRTAIAVIGGAIVTVSNVTSGGWDAVYAREGASVTVKGNVYGAYRYGVSANDSGTLINVLGDVSSNQRVAQASGGAKVTIDGAVQASGANLFYIDAANYQKNGNNVPSSKPGYLEYTNGTSYVWVKDTNVPTTLYGDVDDNGIVNPLDSSRLIRYFGRNDLPTDGPINEANSNVNGDNVLNPQDSSRLMRFFNRQDPSPLGPSAGPASIGIQGSTFMPFAAALAPVNEPIILVSDARGIAGEEVTLRATLEDNRGITSYFLTMNYDSDKLTFIGAEDGGMLTNSFTPVDLGGGKIALSAYTPLATDIGDSKVDLFAITFRINEGIEDGVIDGLILDYSGQWDGIESNNEFIVIPVIEGSITVDAAMANPPIDTEPVNAKAEFISIGETSKNSKVWILAFKVRETYSDGNSVDIPYAIELSSNNGNVNGSYDLGAYTLFYDIKGSSSNIKEFCIVMKTTALNAKEEAVE
jgi:hypothetical protein